MEIWFATSVAWVALALWLCRARLGGSIGARAREIAFAPREPVTPSELFGQLLSANLAILEHDDFNQLGSRHGATRVRSLLDCRWRVTSRDQCLKAIERRMGRLGEAPAAEEAAYFAWRSGTQNDSLEYQALLQTCKFLADDAGIVELRRVREIHLNPVACDVQHLAYLTRLGFSAGYLSRIEAGRILERLQLVAKRHYASWDDFSLSALVCMGVRSLLDSFDLGDWRKIARSHQILLAAHRCTLSRATGWVDRIEPRRDLHCLDGHEVAMATSVK